MNANREYARGLVVIAAFGAGWMAGTLLFDFAVDALDPSQQSSPAAYQVMRAEALLAKGGEALLWLAAAGVFLLPAFAGAALSQPGLTRKWLMFPAAALVGKSLVDLWPLRFKLPYASDDAVQLAILAAGGSMVGLLLLGGMLGLVFAVFLERVGIRRGLSSATREDKVRKRQREKLET